MSRVCMFLSFLLFAVSCEEKHQRSYNYKVDLFEDERREANKPYIMNEDEAYEGSTMVLAGAGLSLADSSAGRGKAVFIYKLQSGKILKSKTDSVVKYPFFFISTLNLKISKTTEDSVYVYLERLKGYQFIAAEKGIKYQWLKNAPLYKVKKEDK